VPTWTTAAPPLVAIEISSQRVTVVQVTRSAGKVAVASLASEPLPAGALTPALTGTNIVQRDVVVAAAKRALDRAGLGSTRRAALVVPDSIARVSLVPLEHVPAKAQDLDQLLRWQLKRSMPFPLEEAQVSHFTASTEGTITTMATVVARRDVVSEYEAIAGALGIHAGIVDLASFNVMNAIIAAGGDGAGDGLLVHLAPEATTLAILRGGSLLFYRHRGADEEPLGALVHQTAMYHEDRLGGGAFARVWLCGGRAVSAEARDQISGRLGVPIESVDVRPAATLAGQSVAAPDLLDALVAPVGALLVERAA
jgi:Tfp pilus assembly PilM family ATPase